MVPTLRIASIPMSSSRASAKPDVSRSQNPKRQLSRATASILFATYRGPNSRHLCAARDNAQGQLVSGGTTVIESNGVRPALVVGRDTFLVAGPGKQFLVVRDSDDGLAVVNRRAFPFAKSPIVARQRFIVAASEKGGLTACTIRKNALKRTDGMRPEPNADGDRIAPFQLDNGLIISVDLVPGQARATIIATRLRDDGTLQRLGQVIAGWCTTCLPAPGNHVVVCEQDTKSITVYRVDAGGQFVKVDEPVERLKLARLIVNADGNGIAGAPFTHLNRNVFVPVHFSGRGSFSPNMKASFTSTQLPILTRNGTLIRTSEDSVIVEHLNGDGTRTPLGTAERVIAKDKLTVTPNGTILVPTENALVALGGA